MEHKEKSVKDKIDADIEEYTKIAKSNPKLYNFQPWLLESINALATEKTIENVTAFYNEVEFYEQNIMLLWFVLSQIEDLDTMDLSVNLWSSFKDYVNDPVNKNEEETFRDTYIVLKESMMVIRKKKLISGFAYMYDSLNPTNAVNYPQLVYIQKLFRLLMRLYPNDFAILKHNGEQYIYNPSNNLSIKHKNLIQLGYKGKTQFYLSVLLGYTVEQTLFDKFYTDVFNKLLDKDLTKEISSYFNMKIEDMPEINENSPYFAYYAYKMTQSIITSANNRTYLEELKKEYKKSEEEIKELIVKMDKEYPRKIMVRKLSLSDVSSLKASSSSPNKKLVSPLGSPMEDYKGGFDFLKS